MKTGRYTKQEDDIIIKYYATSSSNEMQALLPHRDKVSICGRARTLGIKKKNFYWTKEKEEILKKGYEDNLSVSEISTLLGGRFNKESIYTHANKLGLKMKLKWTDSDIQHLKEFYPYHTLPETLIEFPQRTKDGIIGMAQKLGLTSCVPYKLEEDNYIKENWQILSDFEMSQFLNRTERAVKARRIELHLFRRDNKSRNYNNFSDLLRNNLSTWRRKSEENCNYSCVITGDTINYDVHHIYGLSLIVDELIEKLDLNLDDYFSYTQEQIDIILVEFKKIHNTYPLGVCLRKDVHMLFHSLYGFGNNTPEQFEHFKTEYYKGTYDKKIA